MKSFWIIKVTYLRTQETRCTEAYKTLERCKQAIDNKLQNTRIRRINEYTIKDLDEDIIYEAELTYIFD